MLAGDRRARSRTRDLVGGGASVDRATLMAVVYFGAPRVRSAQPAAERAGVVAALLVAADPLAVADPGVPPHLRRHARRSSWSCRPSPRRRSVRAACSRSRCAVAARAASVAAEALLFPVGALVFSRVTFAGLALNFAGDSADGRRADRRDGGRAAARWSRRRWRRRPAGSRMSAPTGSCGRPTSCDSRRLLTWRVAPPPWVAVVVYYVAVVAGWTLWRRRVGVAGSAETRLVARVRLGARWRVAVCAALWILVEPWALVAARGDGRLHVTFLDVGQGDCALRRASRAARRCWSTPAGCRRLVGVRHRRPRRRAGAARRRRPAPRLPRADPRRSRSHRRRARRSCASSGRARCGKAFRCRGSSRSGAAAGGAGVGRALDERLRGRSADDRRRRGRRARIRRRPTGSGRRCGTTTRSCSSCAGATCRCADRRHRPGRRARARAATPAVAAAGPEGAAPRQPDVEHAGVPATRSRPQVAVVSAGRSNHFGHPAPAVLERYRASARRSSGPIRTGR